MVWGGPFKVQCYSTGFYKGFRTVLAVIQQGYFEGFAWVIYWLHEAYTGLLSSLGEKSINFYSIIIVVLLRKK